MKIKYRVIGELKKRVKEPVGEVDSTMDVKSLLDVLGLSRNELVVMIDGKKAAHEQVLAGGNEVVIIPFAVGG